MKLFFKDIKKLFPIGGIVFYPFLIFLIVGFFYVPSSYGYLKEIIAFGLFSSILFVLLFLFKTHKIRKLLFNFSTLLLSLLIIIKLFFYSTYGTKLSTSALYVIFESNKGEISGYFSDFIKTSRVLFFLIILFALLFFIKRYLSIKKIFNLRNIPILCFTNNFAKIIVLVFVILSSVFINKKFNDENILIEIYNSYAEYIDLKTKLKNTLAKEKNDHIKLTSKLDIPQTYVVIIGESTSNWHMQLYGYERETNPLLLKIKDELIVFKDVITPHVHTMASLEKILTMSDYSNPKIKENSSIIQLANEAGFTTYWLSNQQPIGIDESIPTLIGNAAQNRYFMNTDDYGDNVYDEKLLPQLESILNEHTQKKVVFVHLMGTHTPYRRRYPEKFQYFNKESGYKSKINEYDNAIRYNDFIIRNIIEKVRNQKTNSFVLYFSDHGDEVYDTMDFFGHNEYHATKPMYEVPFVVWLSKEYKRNNFQMMVSDFLIERKYNLENFIHSFSDLSQIRFDRFDSTKSIFNNKFEASKRLIKKGIDYDKD